jgi:hypothetical protein
MDQSSLRKQGLSGILANDLNLTPKLISGIEPLGLSSEKPQKSSGSKDLSVGTTESLLSDYLPIKPFCETEASQIDIKNFLNSSNAIPTFSLRGMSGINSGIPANNLNLTPKLISEIESLGLSSEKPQKSSGSKDLSVGTTVKDANFSYWGQVPYWTLDEATMLLLGQEPETFNTNKKKSFNEVSESAAYKKLFLVLERAIYVKELGEPLKPDEVLYWCQCKDRPFPQELKTIILNQSKNRVNLQALYDGASAENKQLHEKIEELKEECKKLRQAKAPLQRSLNTSNKIIAGIINAKFKNNASLISNVQSCLEMQGIHADDKTIRDRYNKGLEIIKQKSEA